MSIVLKGRKSSIWTMLVGLLAVGSMLLSGCSVVNDLKDISDAGNTFLAALNKGDAAGAAAMMHSRAQQSGDMATALQENFVARKFGNTKVNSTKVENGVGELTGSCDLNDADGNPKSGDLTMQLQKDGDNWKVINVSCKIG
ncbi:MAG: hypothetical protein M1434_02175 [Chloroflexi bacterium]|nr:hypothetical protein [Chloroflexota bacterium]MCL5273536.1 hypothetical protein [Chloroflexota bacterium]